MTPETRARAADLAERLRDWSRQQGADFWAQDDAALLDKAAAEIERLRRIPAHYGAPTDDPDAAIQWITGLMDSETRHLRAEIERLRAALRDCAEDLEAYVRAEYGDEPHPAMKHRFDRDMAPVLAARAALERAP